MVVFERFMNFRKSGGNHCQLNVIPVPARASAGARAAVQKTASTHGFDLQDVPGASKVGAPLFRFNAMFTMHCLHHAKLPSHMLAAWRPAQNIPRPPTCTTCRAHRAPSQKSRFPGAEVTSVMPVLLHRQNEGQVQALQANADMHCRAGCEHSSGQAMRECSS